jgi:hypothetical protein
MQAPRAILSTISGASVAAVSLLISSGGCGSDNTVPPSPPAKLASYCNNDSDCGPGVTCLHLPDQKLGVTWTFCSVPCKTDADCAGHQMVCGVAPDGSGMCFDPCTADTSYFVCLNGVPTACGQVDQTHCASCGCPAALRCVATVGCMDKVDVGGACQTDSDCKSDNCSAVAQVCRVALGQACTAANCDVCFTSPDWSYCSRECQSVSDCGDGMCVSESNEPFYCRLRCSSSTDAACPGTCAYAVCPPGGICQFDSSHYYCGCSDCTVAASTSN